jgi:CheY-like chemotaxis protein
MPGLVDAVLTKPAREQSLLDAFAQLFGFASPRRAEPVSALTPRVRQAGRRPLRILLAEDNKINQQLVTMLLRKADHEVDVAENGEVAVEAVRNGDYQVVLMDIQMPILDGVQATKRIRELPPPKNAVAIIALTAHAMAGAKEEYLAAQMDDYLSKPIDDVELFTRLDNVAAGISGRAATITPVAKDTVPLTTIDPARLEMVAEVMVGEPLDEFIDVFLNSAAQRIREIRDLTEGGDLARVGEEAHTLFGTAGNFGAVGLSQLAGKLRAACDTGDRDLVRRLAEELVEVANSTAASLVAWLAERKAEPVA